MKRFLKNKKIFCIFLLFTLIIFGIGIASATENTGQGKPRGVDIYIRDVPYSASLSGAVNSSEKGVGDFKVIIDDNLAKNPDPAWFANLGNTQTPTPTPTPTETPTMVPTPTATEVIPVDIGGVGKSVCVLDNTSDVIVDFAYSSAGYKNVFKLSSPTSVSLGWSQGEMPSGRVGTAFGTTWNLGKFTRGQELIFADTANGVTYYTGPASRNGDGIAHAAITLKNATGTYQKYLVTFEDFWGGGDKDYNDLEFYLSGNLSLECSTVEITEEEDDESGAVTPVYVEGSVCKCSSKYNSGGKTTCVAQFTYTSTVDNMIIPVHESSLPWNEFTGSGMVEQYRCQPTTFYIDSSRNTPFWTNRFWNNIKWKLGNDQSVLVKCTKSTPLCSNSDSVCTDCKSNDGKR